MALATHRSDRDPWVTLLGSPNKVMPIAPKGTVTQTDYVYGCRAVQFFSGSKMYRPPGPQGSTSQTTLRPQPYCQFCPHDHWQKVPAHLRKKSPSNTAGPRTVEEVVGNWVPFYRLLVFYLSSQGSCRRWSLCFFLSCSIIFFFCVCLSRCFSIRDFSLLFNHCCYELLFMNV